MKYLIRSIKYFLYFAIMFCLIVLIVFYASSHPEGMTVADLFKEGSGYKILAFFVAVSAIYPLFGFAKKEVYTNNNAEEKKQEIIKIFENANFILENETGRILTFRPKSKFTRFMRMNEDAVTVDYSSNPVIVEGLRKDTYRFGRMIEFLMQKEVS